MAEYVIMTWGRYRSANNLPWLSIDDFKEFIHDTGFTTGKNPEQFVRSYNYGNLFYTIDNVEGNGANGKITANELAMYLENEEFCISKCLDFDHLQTHNCKIRCKESCPINM